MLQLLSYWIDLKNELMYITALDKRLLSITYQGTSLSMFLMEHQIHCEIFDNLDDLRILMECKSVNATILHANRISSALLAIYQQCGIPNILFIAENVEQISNSFAFSPLDFLLLPVMEERLINSLEKVKRKINFRPVVKARKVVNDKVIFKTLNGYCVINPKDIVYFAKQDHHVYLYTANDKPIIIRESLKEVYKRLAPNMFLRINRSSIIHLRYLEGCRNIASKSYAILKTGTRLPIVKSAEITLKTRLYDLYQGLGG